jgi:hypothetical protein
MPLGAVSPQADESVTSDCDHHYGSRTTSVYLLANKFWDLGLTPAFPPIPIKETPTDAIYQLCEKREGFGTMVVPRSQNRAIKTLGRIWIKP